MGSNDPECSNPSRASTLLAAGFTRFKAASAPITNLDANRFTHGENEA